MAGGTVFGTPLTFVDWALASHDETSLEQQAIDTLKDETDWNLTYRQLFKEALRLVDALKISGRYESEKSRLAQIVQEAQEDTARETKERFKRHWETPEMQEFLSHMSNLLAGIRSPDPEQRARFRDLMDQLELWNKTPREVPVALLRALERAKLPKGRKSIPTPWANVTEHMDAMRLAVASGDSIHEAARARAILEQTAGEAERARTLAKLYRQKMALRE